VLDPDFATALWALGGTYEYDDQDRAISILSRCLEIAPSAGSCLRRRSAVYTDKGRCRELEAEARRMTVVEPSGTRPYEFLAMALAAVNAPRPSVEQALLKRTSLAGDADARAAMTVEGSLWLALLDGDLIAAEAAARSQLALAEGAQTESEHDLPMERLLDVLEERGDRARALSEADVFEKRSAAWTPDAPWGVHLRLALMRYDAGQIDRKTLSDTLQGLRNRGLAAGTTGTIAYGFGPSRALFLSKPDEAVDALAEHPTARESAIEDLPDYQWIRSFGLGRTLLLAGRPADAVAPLRAAARSCKVLMDADSGLAETIWLMRADLALGQALEQTGQPAEACAAYAPVLERWSHPIPRSVSVDAAREAMRRLRCAR
jgi:tetratricopeptide (TPR) repeat protein